jgi:hypothetical protein
MIGQVVQGLTTSHQVQLCVMLLQQFENKEGLDLMTVTQWPPWAHHTKGRTVARVAVNQWLLITAQRQPRTNRSREVDKKPAKATVVCRNSTRQQVIAYLGAAASAHNTSTLPPASLPAQHPLKPLV